MRFPRWTGPRGKPQVLMGTSSLVQYIQTYNGRKPCTVSVYAFERWRNQKPYVQSALIDSLYTKGKPEIMLEYVRDLDLSSVRHTARYDGESIDIIVPLGTIVPSLREEISKAREIVDIPYSQRTWNVLLWNRTWNTKTKRYVTEVLSSDTLEDLDALATKPLKRPRSKGTIIRRLYPSIAT